MSGVRFATIDGDRPLRGVVVGAGFLGPFWVRELLASADTEVAGWVDVDPARLARRTAELKLDGLPRGTDLDAMLAAERPDFVVNVTAPEAHREVTLSALAHGAAVLSEKPLATSMDAAREMVAAADAAQRLLMVSQNRRYMPTLIALPRRRRGPRHARQPELRLLHRAPGAPGRLRAQDRAAATARHGDPPVRRRPLHHPAPSPCRCTASPTRRRGTGSRARAPRTPSSA